MGHRRQQHRAAGALAATIVLVVVARLWGLELLADGVGLKLNAVPWFGRWETTMRPVSLVWPVAFAALVVAVGPPIARRTRLAVLLALTGAASAVWASLLYLADRPLSLVGEPLEGKFEYLAAVPEVDSPAGFLSGFVDQIATYPIHVQGHPPGMVLLLWGLDQLGLGGATPAAVMILLAAASTPVAVVLTARELLSDDVARRAAPFLVLTPSAIWVATTADALFTAVGAWAILLVVLSTRPGRRGAVAFAVAGGALFALGLHLTYGLAPLGIVPAVVIVTRRAWTTAAAGAAAGAAVVVSWTAAGFFLLDGLDATSQRYDVGVASNRPYSYFVVANLAVLAVSLGPPAIMGLASMRRDLATGAVWAAVVAVVAADVSGLSKGEVERIWLPYVPWITLAAACTAIPAVVRVANRRIDRDRVLLGAQAAVGVVLAAFLRSPW
ncbi:hypothetical protein [Actinospongicola halichondriae]|uniref:hypothetical protein n=1 Tax=Actinospongicola halichondriae TaxID=3236844 RepID=UPI003D4BD2DB